MFDLVTVACNVSCFVCKYLATQWKQNLKNEKKKKEKKMQMLHLQSKGWANCVHLQFESDFSSFVLELGEYLKNVSRQVHHLDLFYDHSNIITAKSQTGFCQLVEEYIFFPRNTRLPDCCRQVSMSVDDITTSCLGVLLTTPENALCNFKTNSEKSILRNIHEPMDAAIAWLIHIYLTHKIQSSKTHVT